MTFTTIATGQIEVNLGDHVGQGVQLQLFHDPASDESRVAVDFEPPYHVSYSDRASTYYLMIYTESSFDDASPYTLWARYPSDQEKNHQLAIRKNNYERSQET